MTTADSGRHETVEERADRNWDELLQELRVMQTGAQILTAFLLAVAFQPRFTELDPLQLALYVTLVVLAAVATVLALTPVGLHRMLFHRRLKAELVAAAAVILKVELGVIGLLTIGVTALILDFALGRTASILALGIGMPLIALLWLLLPRRLRRLSRARRSR
ncbi:DUF6328 family protein [Microbacterium sp.]|uniref:DUF6328 family protein n=1 Tax=Microbacterium sp. TaxID=51671 RepID=UPI0039E2942C